MNDLSFRVTDFEGPLDLLLTLISKHKLDLREVSLFTLIEQYMDAISQWQQADLDIASSFLEMASRLVHMKTVLLLPRHEEGEKLKAELHGQLIEYSLCKLAAQLLGRQNGMFARFVRDPLPFSGDMTYQGHHFRGELYEAYQDAIGRGKRRLPPSVTSFTPLVARRVVSVNSRMVILLRNLYAQGAVDYSRLFDDAADRSELVATFLALLEMMKDNRVTIDENARVSLRKDAPSVPEESSDTYATQV